MGHLSKHHNQIVAETAGGSRPKMPDRRLGVTLTGRLAGGSTQKFVRYNPSAPSSKGKGKGRSNKGKGKGKGRKGKGKGGGKGRPGGEANEKARAAVDDTGNTWDDYFWDYRQLSPEEFIATDDDWLAADLEETDFDWMIEITEGDSIQERVVAFSDLGLQAMSDYVWYWADQWIEPAAYARDYDSAETYEEVEGHQDAAEAGETPEPAGRLQEETETVRRGVTTKTASSSSSSSSGGPSRGHWGTVVLGGLGDSFCYRGETSKKAVDCDIVDLDDDEEPTRASQEVERRVLGKGWNLEVMVCIGMVPCTCLLDTGAARNIIKSSFRKRLQSDPETATYVYGPYSADRTVHVAGIHTTEVRSVANDINTVVDVVFRFM
jgi:hypothetical protein